MSEPMTPPQEDTEWEGLVRRMAADMLYPPTPNIAGKVRQRLEHQIPVRLRLAQAAAVILLILAGLMTVPQVRAEVLRILQIGVIRVIFDEPITPTLASIETQSATRTPHDGTMQSVLELSGETTFEDAQQSISFEIRLPTYPGDLGEPDHVFVMDAGGDVVVLVWVDPNDPDTPILSLFQFGVGSDVWKHGVSSGQELEIDGDFAMWTDDPHILEFFANGRNQRRSVIDTVLVWFHPPISYRLEGAESLEEAIKIMQSMGD